MPFAKSLSSNKTWEKGPLMPTLPHQHWSFDLMFLWLQSHLLPTPVHSQPCSLAEQLSDPALCPLPDFKKKSTEEVVGILEKKVSTTIKCYQAIFYKKYLFKSLLGESQHTLHHFADQLNWVSDNFDKANNWSKQQCNSISCDCCCVGTVKFSTPQEPLVKQYRKVTKDLTSIANWGYLDWIVL